MQLSRLLGVILLAGALGAGCGKKVTPAPDDSQNSSDMDGSSGSTTSIVMATGGTVTKYMLNGTNFTAHIFTNSGIFTNTLLNSVEVLIVAGGGGGGNNGGGGGGAGGVIYNPAFAVIGGKDYSVTVGGGGLPHPNNGSDPVKGGDSVFDTLMAIGGGGGSSRDQGGQGATGGSGGGGGGAGETRYLAGNGTTGQGNNGGSGSPLPDQGGDAAGGGGGGAGGAGVTGDTCQGGQGGAGVYYEAFAKLAGHPAGWFAGGGGGSRVVNGKNGAGGKGGGGDGGGVAGAPNTGGGGGGGGAEGAGGQVGGSGIVIVRYVTKKAPSGEIIMPPTPQTNVVDQPTNTPPAEPPPVVEVVDEALDAEVRKVVALEQEADFVAALQLCQTLKETFRTKLQQKKLTKLTLRLINEKKASGDLQVALNNLLSGQEDNVLVAEQKLSEDRETGGILLRKALRCETDERALPVARLLADMRDAQALPVFTAQLAIRKAPPLIEALVDGVKNMISGLGTNEIAAFYQLMLSDTNFAHSRSVSVLETVLRKRSGGDAVRFNQLVGAVDGYDNLRAYIEKALLATDTNQVAWACDYGGALIGTLNAVSGQYYADPAFQNLATQRVDTLVVLGNRQFPLEDGRFNEVSARWSARLEVPRAGDYTFYANAMTRGEVFVNGQSVVVSRNGAETNATIKLPAGQLPCRVDYVCQQSQHSSGLQVSWSGSNMPRQVLSSASLRILPWYDAVLPLRPAIRQLVSTNFAELRAAKALLAWSGETGNIFLRDAFQNEADPIALRAAELLAARGDRRSTALLIARVEQQPDSPLLPALTTILCDMAPLLDPQQIRHLYQGLLQDADAAMVPQAAALCAVLNRVCENDKDRFNKTVQDPKGYDLLSRYVQRAMISSNDAAVARACEFGAPFAPVLTGLRGHYFLGHQNDKLVTERLESYLEFQLRPHYDVPNQFPGEIQQVRKDVSARWTGALRIETAGKYDFVTRSEGTVTIYVDEKPVVTGWQNTREGQKGTLALTPGLHALRIEFSQPDSPYIQIAWGRTNVAQQVLSGPVLSTQPWRSLLLPLPAAIDDLASTNQLVRRAARGQLTAVQDCGAVFLRNAMRYKSDAVAKPAALLLALQNDAQAAPVLIDRIRKNPDAPIVPDLLENLRTLAGTLTPELVPPLYEAFRADTEARMIPEASMLCVLLDRTCGGRAEEFNKLVKDPKGYALLKAYVARACTSQDDAIVQRAGQFGAPFVADAPGLCGNYYQGSQWNELATERLATSVNQPRRQYPVADAWQTDLSARWTGFLLINQPGPYTLCVQRGQSQVQLWLDGKILPMQQVPRDESLYSNTVVLAKGTHLLRLELQGGGEWNQLALLWNGPGFSRQVIPADALRTPLWSSELDKMPAAINSLVSTNWAEARVAKTTLLQAGTAGRLFLWNAIRYKPDPVAKVAAQMLAEQKDALTAPLLVERIRKSPDAAIVPDFLENLRDLAEFIPADLVPPLLTAVRNDKDFRMIHEASMLCILLDRACGGRGEDFNKLAKDPKAYDLLKAYVARACTSQDDAIVLRVGQFGAPFVADAPGLRGRYYFGTEFDSLAADQLDAAVSIPNGWAVFPGKRIRDVSARWTGTLLVKQAGKHVLALQYFQSKSRLWIDGNPVVFPGPDTRNQTNVVTLTEGPHQIRVDYQFDADWNELRLLWSKPGNNKLDFISAEALRTPLSSSELAKLPPAIDALTSTNVPEVRAARSALLRMGEPGALFLRNAIRHKPDSVAKEAAMLLAAQSDAPGVPLIIERIRKAPDAAIVPDLLESLRELAGQITPDLLPPLYEAVKKDTESRMIPEASLLCIALDRTCGGRAEEFNKLVKDPKGYAQLKAYVAQACCANNDAIVLRAGQFGAPFVADAPGLRGRYYLGTEFDSLALDQLDAAVNLPQGWSVFPGKRTRDVSARWTGTLLVKQPGVHVLALQYFQSKSRLWIDGNPVVFPGPDTRNQTNVVTLSAGPHRIRVDYQYGQADWNELRLMWSKPGTNKLDFISAEALRTPLSSSELAKLPPAIDALTSTNVPEVRAARSALLRMGEPGALFLRNAIRHKPDPVAKAAAALLAAQSDAPGVPLLIERIRKAPDAAVVPDLLESLRELAGQFTPDLLPPLYEAVKKDKEARMIPEASLLCIALDRTCGGRAEEFNKLVKDSKAYDQLKAYVARACVYKNGDVLLRAAQFGAPFVADAPGLRGRYYLGAEYDLLALERLDAAVNVPSQQYPMPGKRQRDISARWSGSLLVKQAGDYVFSLQAVQTSAQLWIDDKNIITAAGGWEPKTNGATLTAGTHRIRVDFQCGGADHNPTQLGWKGPGITQQIIPADVLRTPLWAGELQKLRDLVAGLGTTNVQQMASLTNSINSYGAPAKLFLRHLANTETSAASKKAAALLDPK